MKNKAVRITGAIRAYFSLLVVLFMADMIYGMDKTIKTGPPGRM
jgi:hypothetical protein